MGVMQGLLTIIFLAFLVSNFYILRMNKKAAVKRKAFRWWLIVAAAFLVLYLSLVVQDKVLLVFVLPVLAGVLFGMFKFTKFCDWCGRFVQTNLPFRRSDACPRCGSPIS